MSTKVVEILKQSDPDGVINELKKRPTPSPEKKAIDREFTVAGHKVMDPAFRPNKRVKTDHGEKIVEVVRIAVPLQKMIVKKAASFLFGIPVKYGSNPVGDKQKALATAISKVAKKCKLSSHDRRLARDLFSYTEAAEYWYTVDRENNDYGFKSKKRLKVAIFSPKNGDKLFPRFDEYGDLIAFSREYIVVENGVDTPYFETYTDTAIYKWKKSSVSWEFVEMRTHDLGKIPIVYGCQEDTEWADVQKMIERLETLLSNFGDTNDYHGSPKILVKGQLKGFAQKGESGAILEIDGDGGDAKYLSWDHAPESVKLEIETLLRLIFSCTQTPDLSFDAVKGLGDVSGVALKLLFMDAHLKVIEKREIFDEFMERRISVIKTFLSKMDTSLASAAEELEIEPEITPYMIDDEKGTIENLMTATGNKPILSQKTAVSMSGLVVDAEAEHAQILKEEKEAQAVSLFEPTN